MSETGDAAGQSAPPFASQAGTTLIEALVVVAITTMVALIGFPRMQQGLLTLAQRQTVSVVAARLRQARAEALRRDTPVVFAIAPDGRAYRASNGGLVQTPDGVSLTTPSGPGGRILFHGDGSSSGGAVWISAGRRTIAVLIGAPGGDVAIGPG